MDKLTLDGIWELTHCPDGQGTPDSLSNLEWIPAQVPGEAHLDLMRAGKLPDPFFDLNHLKTRDLEQHEFWYRRSFHVPPQMTGDRVELVFSGLDCFATVWLNGLEVGRSANALVPRVFDVTQAVRPGETNHLLVRLASPIKAVEGLSLEGCNAGMDTIERLWARKPDQQYGWDIALRLITVGLWRSVALVFHSRALLRDFFFRTDSLADGGASATVALEAEVEPLTADEDDLSVYAVAEGDGSRFEMSAPVHGGRAVMSAVVRNPRLWWPWDLGEPNLYHLTVSLREGDREIASLSRAVGIRTIRLVEEPADARERSFYFEVNGVPFFARGLNWTPCDAIYPRAEPWKQQRLVRFARHLNCNMLRIWGGGIYEPDEFYEECDRLGITIFHDFLYACAIYPQAPKFLEIARDEAETAVRRLRNHPCIALWSGDNENDCAYWWWFGGHRDPWTENRITREVIPEVLARLDGTRGYIPSSPYSPDRDVDPQDPLQGDQHIWYHGTPFWADVYLKSTARFPSEIGHLSCPDLQTVVDMLAEEHRWPPDNRAWDEHFGSLYDWNFRPDRRRRLDAALEAWLGQVPTDLPTYVLASQLIQGEAYKAWAEHWRLRKAGWNSGGILLWNLADCWPQFSDAIVDFWLRPKLACNYTRWAFQPIHICFSEQTADEVAVYAINDTLQEIEAEYVVTALSRGGASMGEMRGRARLGPNSVVRLGNVDYLYAQAEGARGKLVAQLFAGGQLIASNIRRAWQPTLEDLPLVLKDVPPLGTAP